MEAGEISEGNGETVTEEARRGQKKPDRERDEDTERRGTKIKRLHQKTRYVFETNTHFNISAYA